MALLDYQERYQGVAHKSGINAVAFSPDGRRFVTGSDDSTVLVWSTGSAVDLCNIRTHSPVLSLAWLTNSNGFIIGCKNGVLMSVNVLEHDVKTSFFKAHTTAISCISPQFNDTFTITASLGEVRIWGRKGQIDQRQQTERWVLKFMLPPPKAADIRGNVEVTSVNWKSQLAGTNASFALVSYKWHGVMCWDVTKATILWHFPMEECSALSLSPDSRFVATFGSSKFFEVRELGSGAVQSLRWQRPVMRPKQLAKMPSVCFAHEGFAVVGAAGGESKVHVWDMERGDQLLSLDHGDGFKVHTLVTKFVKDEDRFLIITGGERQGQFHIFIWATVQRAITALTPSENERHRIELLFMRNFWLNVAFLAVVAVLSGSSRWAMSLYASAAIN